MLTFTPDVHPDTDTDGVRQRNSLTLTHIIQLTLNKSEIGHLWRETHIKFIALYSALTDDDGFNDVFDKTRRINTHQAVCVYDGIIIVRLMCQSDGFVQETVCCVQFSDHHAVLWGMAMDKSGIKSQQYYFIKTFSCINANLTNIIKSLNLN